MTRQSLKEQLIVELERRADELEVTAAGKTPTQAASAIAETFRADARHLRNRGSGPLPLWARRRAAELGLAPPRRRASSSA